MDRLQKAIFQYYENNIGVAADRNTHDWFEGDLFAMARQFDISIEPPFDGMDDDKSFSLVNSLEEADHKSDGVYLTGPDDHSSGL